MAALRPEARDVPESGIVKVANHGWSKGGALIPLWAGEGDMPTPAFISDAATRALAAGETFYTRQRGIPELRSALARYHARVYAREFSAEEFFVTIGGMHAIELAIRATVGPGDEVVLPTPAWPNFSGAMQVAGAVPRYVPMRRGRAGFELDLDALFAACGPKTRAFFINSPANPTGWTATREELAAILEFARRKGIWIIADEIYGRFYWRGSGVAPSFHELRRPDDLILFVNTFSKNWAMTGWRCGWLQAPASIGQVVENLIQFSTSGVPVFTQRGGIAALEEGEPFAKEMIARARQGLDIVTRALSPLNGVHAEPPAGAFYAFISVDGVNDSMELAMRLVDEADVGLAPGVAFGPGGEGNLRLCFLRSPDQLETAMQRLVKWLGRMPR